MMWHILKYYELPPSSSKLKDNRKPYRYPLSVGDVVKFGRVSYKVKRIFDPKQRDKREATSSPRKKSE